MKVQNSAIFLYGSLMDADIRRHVFATSIHDGQIVPAVAQGFCTMTYPGENFPVLLPKYDSHVEGQVLLEPNNEALARMAFYEGDEYGIGYINVNTKEHGSITAKFNQVLDQDLVFDQPWSYTEWHRTERSALVKSAQLYMERCWGKMNIVEADAVWQEIRQLHRTSNIS